jgi:uncharacterized protein with PIN domain
MGMNFIADRMLGKLTKELRMLGYDTIYYPGEDAYRLIKLAREERRVILTRNTKLLPKTTEDRIIRITEDRPSLQIKELIQTGYVSLSEKNFFSRCLLCNALLDDLPREEAEGKVPDFIFYQQKEFYQCPHCLRIYWQGSHQENMLKKIDQLKNVR